MAVNMHANTDINMNENMLASTAVNMDLNKYVNI
jgi:hypothetical protein